MFQIAATVGYAKKYNVPYMFPKWKHQNEFELPNENFVHKRALRFKNKHNEPGYTYSEIPFKPEMNLHGYFQSYKYFDHCKDYIKQIFTPKEPEDTELFRGICAIHVRRGDYLKFPKFHPVQTMEYYHKAMEKVSCNRYLIFSDDVKWCERHFKGNEFIVSEPASSAIDFKMMMACEKFIIANSSFSWWAAWLGEAEEKVVVAPKNWFGKKLAPTHPTKDLIPEDWIQI